MGLFDFVGRRRRTLSLKWDRKLLKTLSDPKLNRALVRALTKAGGDAIRAVRVSSSRRVRERKALKAGKVNKAMTLRFPKGAKHVDDLVWRVQVQWKGTPISEYANLRQVSKGVRVKVNTGRSVLIKSAFLATMKSGHRGVFLRKGKKRLPIDELFTTQIADVLTDKDFTPPVFQRGSEVFAATFARVLPLELDRVRRR